MGLVQTWINKLQFCTVGGRVISIFNKNFGLRGEGTFQVLTEILHYDVHKFLYCHLQQSNISLLVATTKCY